MTEGFHSPLQINVRKYRREGLGVSIERDPRKSHVSLEQDASKERAHIDHSYAPRSLPPVANPLHGCSGELCEELDLHDILHGCLLGERGRYLGGPSGHAGPRRGGEATQDRRDDSIEHVPLDFLIRRVPSRASCSKDRAWSAYHPPYKRKMLAVLCFSLPNTAPRSAGCRKWASSSPD